jgi:signal transduction histidine kinase
MVSNLTSGTASFRPKARLIRLLGDELISDEIMAIVELVKNAYDADAKQVSVGLYDLDDPQAARIEIRDDGEGMDLDTILHAWLEPATDWKRNGKHKRNTGLGRYPLGEKGVGRFAADKLGSELELVSRARTVEQEVSLQVHWNSFENSGYIDEVENTWENRAPRVFTGEIYGTILRIGHMRAHWDATMVSRVRDGLMRLVSPFSQILDFKIILDCPNFPEHSGPVVSSLLERAPYRFIGQVDASGFLHTDDLPVDGVDLRQHAIEKFLHGNNLRVPDCGPFRVALFVWDLDSVGLNSPAIDRETRQALKRFCGVSIYRDGFRVWPYGGPADDWLELNQRRVNNPTMRVSTNQIVGIVEIAQMHNPSLRDRTSREGLLDTPAFRDLKALVLGAIAQLEERRFAARQRAQATVTDSGEADPVLRIINQLRSRSQAGQGTIQLLGQIATTYRQQLKAYEIQQEHLMRLAGIGLTTEQVGSEINRTLAEASTMLRIVLNMANHGLVPEEVATSMKELEGQMWLLSEQLDAIEPLYSGTVISREEPIDVRTIVQQAATVFAYRLHEGNVRLMLETPLPLAIRMARVHLLQVLLHLFDNALHWLLNTASDHRPEIRVRLIVDPPTLIIADSGPGIRRELRDQIFQPFFTGRSDGRGLGLHLAKTILDKYHFSIELMEDSQLLDGANFRILFGKARL